MLQLPNNCTCSNPSVFPKNWKNGGPSLLKSDWRIQYYFKDSSHPYMDNHPNGKLVIVKGMNVFKTLTERRDATQKLLDNELRLLQVEGFNPITKTAYAPAMQIEVTDISPTTPFIDALYATLNLLTVTKNTKDDMRSVINSVDKAAYQLGIKEMPIEKVSRKHIRNVLIQCGNNSKKWSPGRYNTFRGYLMMLFKELVQQEAVPANPLHDISKLMTVSKIRTVLNRQQRIDVDRHLSEVFFDYRQFVHLFFHSGGRMPELLQLKPSMVDLQQQKYRCIVKKRKRYTEVERTIKRAAIPFWQHFLKNCPDDHFLFGTLLKPGVKPMGEDMAGRYWNRYVKKDLGIDVDFYCLKHLNTSEIVDALDEKAAAELNAHTSTAMVIDIYDVNQKKRQHERLKEVNNTFT